MNISSSWYSVRWKWHHTLEDQCLEQKKQKWCKVSSFFSFKKPFYVNGTNLILSHIQITSYPYISKCKVTFLILYNMLKMKRLTCNWHLLICLFVKMSIHVLRNEKRINEGYQMILVTWNYFEPVYT